MNFKSDFIMGLGMLFLAACGNVEQLAYQPPEAKPVSFLGTAAAGLIHAMDFTSIVAISTKVGGAVQIRLSDKKVDLCGTKQDPRRHSEVQLLIPNRIGEHALGGSTANIGQLMFIEGAGGVPIIYNAQVGRVAIDATSDSSTTGKVYIHVDEDNFVNGTFTATSCAAGGTDHTKEDDLPAARVDFR